MAFRLARNEPAGAGITRIVQKQIDGVLRNWEQRDLNTAMVVHNARKSCKMIRGALRRVRPRSDAYSRENKCRRDGGASHSKQRNSSRQESYSDVRESVCAIWPR